MSQAGLLSEEEIKDYIFEKLNARLEREQLLKPTKEFVFDIYSKFLDDLYPNWRNCKMEDAPHKIVLVGRMRDLFKHYSTLPTFQLTDLTAPNRKRTNIYLNALIYVKERVDEAWSEHMKSRDEQAAYRERVQARKAEIAQLRANLEELAIKKATGKQLEELRAELEREKLIFKQVSQESEQLQEQANKIKADLSVALEQKKSRQKQKEQLNKEIAQLEADLVLLREAPQIKDRCKALEASVEKKSEQLQSVQNEIQELNAKIAKLVNFRTLNHVAPTGDDIEAIEIRLQQQAALLTELSGNHYCHLKNREEIDQKRKDTRLRYDIQIADANQRITRLRHEEEEVRRRTQALKEQHLLRIEEIETKTKAIQTQSAAHTDKYKSYLDNASQKLDIITRNFREGNKFDREMKVARKKTIEHMEALLGKPKENEPPPVKAADCTYIKETKDK